MNRLIVSMLAAAGTLLPFTASASVPPPVAIPEPGMFSLLGAGVVGALIVARFLRKK